MSATCFEYTLVPTILYMVAMKIRKKYQMNLGFVGPCSCTHSNKSTNHMQQLITGLLFVV